VETHDVVVVGCGIAGGALAAVLAGAGLDVLVLERDPVSRDRVRGETVQLWGVAELRALGLEDVLRAAGGSDAGTLVPYDEIRSPAEAEAAAAPLGSFLPGVAGNLDVGHAEACAALAVEAAARGAEVRRGVRVLDACAGRVRFDEAGTSREVRTRLVVGADGRRSAVRERAGIGLRQTTPRTLGGGLLVDGLDWPSDRIAIGTQGDLHFFVFPRAGGRARLYLLHAGGGRRFTGPRAAADFLAAWSFDCLPDSAAFREARPAGPCAFTPMNDGWADAPSVPGVVLVGDAAGWNDPIAGQGLSVALRDARAVAEVMTASGDWSPAAFAGYAEERRERMRRLRLVARWRTDLYATFTPAAAARRRAWAEVWPDDPVLAGMELAMVLGPHAVEPETFTRGTGDRLRAVTGPRLSGRTR
jgi:2-polyprenyl-6-methoxyphenol hydroxylase-like FAD-dependent oxidoreductase